MRKSGLALLSQQSSLEPFTVENQRRAIAAHVRFKSPSATITLYQTAQLGIDNEQERKWFQNLLILSGGYGVVRVVDLIGSYNLAMVEKLWPRGLLQEVIEAFARKRKIRRVFAFASETTGYAAILGKVDWRSAGVEQALLLSPEASTGAMVKAPRAIGEALKRIRSGGLESSWRSSDGLKILSHRML